MRKLHVSSHPDTRLQFTYKLAYTSNAAPARIQYCAMYNKHPRLKTHLQPPSNTHTPPHWHMLLEVMLNMLNDVTSTGAASPCGHFMLINAVPPPLHCRVSGLIKAGCCLQHLSSNALRILLPTDHRGLPLSHYRWSFLSYRHRVSPQAVDISRSNNEKWC